MKRCIYCLIVVLICLALNGCDKASLMNKMTSPEDKSTAISYIEMLRQNKFDQIENDLDSSIKSPDIRATLVKMANLIPATNPESVRVVGSQIMNGPSMHTANITFEYKFSEKWLLINVAIQKKKGVSTILGFNVNPIPSSLEHMNRFTLAGKGTIHYLMLGLVFLAPLFTLYALVLCIRAKLAKNKWLWIIFIVFGIAKFSLNWTTGQWLITPLAVQFFSAGAFAPAYGPWTLSVSLPLGAIIFLFVRRRIQTSELTTA